MPGFEIVQFTARSDNFAVLVHDPASGLTASIDAPDAAAIQRELATRNWRLTQIWVTHKHLDHVEGLPALKQAFAPEIIGPAKSAAEVGLYDRTVDDGDRFEFAGTAIEVFATPGHTLDHVSFYLPAEQVAFVGDTLFALGCGRLFEGTPAMMWDSLRRLRELPDDTRIYCGHEYTLSNARFAVTVDPTNQALAERLAEIERLRSENRPTLPTTIGRERATNPFVRADDPAVARAIGMSGQPADAVFAEIRGRKDRF